jgi:hypothetical protein
MPKLPKFENQLQFFAVPEGVLILNGLAKSHRAGRKGTAKADLPQRPRRNTEQVNQDQPQSYAEDSIDFVRSKICEKKHDFQSASWYRGHKGTQRK